MSPTEPAPRTFLITGALGAIGVWTARSLLDRGHRVVALDLPDAADHRLAIALGTGDGARDGLTRATGDVTELAEVEAVLAEHDVDGVIHLAAMQVPFVAADPARGARVNVAGTVNVLEAARRRGLTGPVVYASSIAALGPGGTLDGDDAPQTLYGVFKRANEQTALRYAEDLGVASIGLRPHTVYGPGRDQGVTSTPTVAMVAAAARVHYEIPFRATVQLQYTPDVGEAFARTALLSADGASVHNLDGEPLDTVAIARLIDAAAGGEPLVAVADASLPLVGAVDGASFVALHGESLMRPAADGIADAVRRFEGLLADGLVTPPAAADG